MIINKSWCMIFLMKFQRNSPTFELLLALAFGLLIGLLTFIFIEALTRVERLHAGLNQTTPYHLFLIPLVLICIEVIKKNTLYFPVRAAQLTDEVSSQYWSVFMLPVQFFGTLLSHLSGVSVGRESAAVLYSAGLVRLFRLNWLYWGPVVGSIGFSSIVGQFWVAPFFMKEMFGQTNTYQKIYSFVGSITAVLVMKSLGAQHLFHQLSINSEMANEMGFFKKLIFLFLFAAMAGYLMRIYKKYYFSISDYFKMRPLGVKALMSVILLVFLFIPEFRKYQSLGISQFSDLTTVAGTFFDVFSKLFLTLVSTGLGFLGGEFIPLVYSGVYFGHAFFALFGHSTLLGAAFGAYLLFTAATRFKWTGYILILNLMGISWWFWAYFIVALAVGFSGQHSIYKKN